MNVLDVVGAEARHAHYLDKATEADERAAKCKEIETRQTWEELARSWRYIAAALASDFKL